MSSKPAEDEMQVVEDYVRTYCTPLVPLESLYADLESDGMDRPLISHCLIQLEYDDRLWMLHVEDEDRGLPIGGYAYIPYDGQNERLSL